MKLKLTFWKVIFCLIMAMGLYSAFVRFYYGIGAVSNMSDKFPWGIWIGFDVLCGVMLAAGAFIVTGAVYLLNIQRLHAIARPAVLTAFLGYCLVIVGLMFDLGRPWFIWHQLIYMNPHSVMFEVGFCVMFYTTVLMFEFSTAVLERFNLVTPLKMGQGRADSAGDHGHSAFDAAPVFTGHAVSDHADEAASVLVFPGAAVLLLHLGNCGGPGDDDLRIFVEFAGIWTAVGVAGHRRTGRRSLRHAVGLRPAAL